MILEITYDNDTFSIIITHYQTVRPDPLNDVSDWDNKGYVEIDWEFVDIELDYLYSEIQKDEIEEIILQRLTGDKL